MGNWMDPDGLYRQYGTTKAVPTTAGDYLSYGETRQIEVTIDLTTLTASPTILANTTIIPLGVFVESVEIDTEVAATVGTSLSVGLIGLDRTTVSSNTAFVAGALTATMAQGNRQVLVGGSTGAGASVGTVAGTLVAGYLTAIAAGTFTTGKVKVRINYRTTTTITQ